MKTNNLPDYPRIKLADLSRLQLDAESAKRFERRFFPGGIGCAVLVFGGYGVSAALHHFRIISDAAFAGIFIGSFVLGLVVGLWSHHRMMRALPRSVRSGHEMEPFIIQDVEAPAHYELAYIDRASGTYFKRVYVERGG